MNHNKKKRYNSIDLLRTIGIMAVVLAHVSPPVLIKQIRTFDVPLLVIVGGISFGVSSGMMIGINAYIKERLLRLLIPTWTFLIIYFIYFCFIEFLLNNHLVPLEKIVRSFLLLNNGGIGYVWIIRVFILVALSSPFIERFNQKINRDSWYFVIVFFVISMYCFVAEFFIGNRFILNNEMLRILLIEYFLYFVVYSCIYAIGLRLPRMNNGKLLMLLLLTILGYSLYSNLDVGFNFLELDHYKYPPKPIWILYGIQLSVALYLLAKLLDKIDGSYRFLYFVGASTMWIYLWHIFIMDNWFQISYRLPGWMNNYFVKYILIVGGATTITYCQKRIISQLVTKYSSNQKLNYYLKLMFLK